MKTEKITQRIVTTRDGNGNTRAMWLVYELGLWKDIQPVSCHIENAGCKPEGARGLPTLPEIEVAPGYYLKLKAQMKSKVGITY